MKQILFIIFFNLVLISTLLGCGCSRPAFTQQAYDSHKLIFIGKVVDNHINYKEEYQALAFEVIEVLKGQTAKIVTGRNTANTCSASYNMGDVWLIYSNPEYGLINDQYLCAQSTLVTTWEGEPVAGTQDEYPTKKAWTEELNYLRTRKTEHDKIVTYQLVRLVPFLQRAALIVLFVFAVIASERIKLYSPSILPACILVGTLGALFLYLVLPPEKVEFKIALVLLIVASFILLANILYLRWHKGKLTYMKSFVLGQCTYLFMIGIGIPLIAMSKSPNEPVLFEWGVGIFIRDMLFFVGMGLPFSGLIALIFSENFNIFSNKKGSI